MLYDPRVRPRGFPWRENLFPGRSASGPSTDRTDTGRKATFLVVTRFVTRTPPLRSRLGIRPGGERPCPPLTVPTRRSGGLVPRPRTRRVLAPSEPSPEEVSEAGLGHETTVDGLPVTHRSDPNPPSPITRRLWGTGPPYGPRRRTDRPSSILQRGTLVPV